MQDLLKQLQHVSTVIVYVTHMYIYMYTYIESFFNMYMNILYLY